MRRWLLLATALVLASCGSPKAAPPQLPRVSVAHPIARDVIDWDDYVGQFEAIQDVTVTPRVSGTIMKILFQNGQDVVEGQPLFIIDTRPFQAAYQQAVAATGRAEAVLVNSQAELARAERLVESGAISKEGFRHPIIRRAHSHGRCGRRQGGRSRCAFELGVHYGAGLGRGASI